MISRDVHKSPTFDKIAHEFTCSLIYEDIMELEKKCQLFLTILSSTGGPASKEAAALAKDWEQEVLKKHNIKWTLTHKEHEAELNPEIEVNTKDEIAIKLDALKEKFSLLVIKIREYYHNSGQHKVIDVARFISEHLDDNVVQYTEFATIDSIFDAAKKHSEYDFLNCQLIMDLVDKFPLNDDLQAKFLQYVKELEDFYNSTELQQMEKKIRKAVLPKEELHQLTCNVVIKVTGVFHKKTIAHLKILLKYIFGEESKLFKLIDIRKGSLTLVFLAPSSLEQTFILKIKAIQQYIHYLGVFQISINGQTIIDRAEFSNFTLEKSLVDTIWNMHTTKDAELEKLAFLLIQFDININHKDEKGFGALHLASESGHYQLVKALLEKDPDINIQDEAIGRTPLMVASAKGKYQVVELLLSKNPEINIQRKDGATALMLACLSGHQNTAAILLSKNPNISIQIEHSGTTALIIASAMGLPVVETIIELNLRISTFVIIME